MEEVVFVVERERPETVDWRLRAGGKSDFVGPGARERGSAGIRVRIKILRFVRFVVEHVRLRGAGAVEVVESRLGVVDGPAPSVSGRAPVVLPRKKGGHYFLFGSDGGLDQGLLDC